MFRLNKFLSISVVVGLAVVASLLFAYRTITTNNLIEQEERSNTNVAYLMSNVILPQVGNILSQPESLNKTQLERLSKIIDRAVDNTNIIKVKIINLAGLVLYSSDQSQTGQSKYDSEGFNSAIKGVPVSTFSFRDEFNAVHAVITDRHIVSTYIPIRNEGGEKIIGAFEIYSDVTELVSASNFIQLKVGTIVVAGMFIIYLILFKMARRADEIVNAQHEERIANAEQIHYQAYHDQLTGLPNRVNFTERLDEALSRAKRDKSMIGIMFLDIDRFKMINDSLGHHAGDELLRFITRRLEKVTRESDLLFRMGGDEFTIIVEGVDFPTDAAHLAERILQALSEPLTIENHSIVVTISIGISIYPKDDSVAKQLVKNADAAMYQSKQQGRNQYCFYTPEMNSQAADRLILESALQQALSNKEFVLYYQPKVDTNSSQIVSMEALIRWNRPGHGLTPPGIFIHILEDCDLIVGVGEWVMRTAAMQVTAWLNEGLDPKRVSVNVSSRQFCKDNFIDVVKSAIDDAGISPDYLELELTESLLLDNARDAIEVMNKLKEIGVMLSIDDFGTGYSSLSYLKSLPIDYLKIDRCFINEVTTNQKDAAIVNTITTLAEELKIGVVAEGVETEAQWNFLRDKHCQELQGYYFYRPVEAVEMAKLLGQKQIAVGQ